MKKSWFKYYDHHHNIYPSNIFLHWSYLLKIIFLRPGKIMEIGCGPADHSLFLTQILSNTGISLLDKDTKIINILKNKHTSKFSRYYLCDVTIKKNVERLNFQRNQFDIIYSQGLMEHFGKNVFQRIILNFLPYTKRFIFSVPSEKYPTQDFGDELLRNRKELEEILSNINGIKYKISRYLPDIGYRTKLIGIKKYKYNIFRSIYFMLFGSCHYLVEIEKS